MYFQETTFKQINFYDEKPEPGEYENCIFSECDFSNTDISELNFIDCEFKICNLSMAKMDNTIFNEVVFKDCKMLGMQFENCNDLLLFISFYNCTLDHSSFHGLNLKTTLFKNCKLHNADFTGTGLFKSVFENCDLQNAVFINANLQKSDFRQSYNYIIDPEINRIQKAKFDLPGVFGLLAKYDISIT